MCASCVTATDGEGCSGFRAAAFTVGVYMLVQRIRHKVLQQCVILAGFSCP